MALVSIPAPGKARWEARDASGATQFMGRRTGAGSGNKGAGQPPSRRADQGIVILDSFTKQRPQRERGLRSPSAVACEVRTLLPCPPLLTAAAAVLWRLIFLFACVCSVVPIAELVISCLSRLSRLQKCRQRVDVTWTLAFLSESWPTPERYGHAAVLNSTCGTADQTCVQGCPRTGSSREGDGSATTICSLLQIRDELTPEEGRAGSREGARRSERECGGNVTKETFGSMLKRVVPPA